VPKHFPNETIPNVKIPNPKNGENPERKNPNFLGDFSVLEGLTQPTTFPPTLTAKLGEGKGCGLLVSIGNLS
jgi:hypothetical protein